MIGAPRRQIHHRLRHDRMAAGAPVGEELFAQVITQPGIGCERARTHDQVLSEYPRHGRHLGAGHAQAEFGELRHDMFLILGERAEVHVRQAVGHARPEQRAAKALQRDGRI